MYSCRSQRDRHRSSYHIGMHRSSMYHYQSMKNFRGMAGKKNQVEASLQNIRVRRSNTRRHQGLLDLPSLSDQDNPKMRTQAPERGQKLQERILIAISSTFWLHTTCQKLSKRYFPFIAILQSGVVSHYCLQPSITSKRIILSSEIEKL